MQYIELQQMNGLKIHASLEYYVGDPPDKEHEVTIVTIVTTNAKVVIRGIVGSPQLLANQLRNAAAYLQPSINYHEAQRKRRHKPEE